MSLDSAWVRRWRDDMRALAERINGGFQERYGFAPGEHRISGPAADEEWPGVPEDLSIFYSVVGEVSLPDVHVGYWVHRPSLDGFPEALSDGRRIVVFGTDGGGGMFALPDAGQPVLHLVEGGLHDGVHDADHVTEVAADLREFLVFLHRQAADTAGD
ncbi:hypothetical protein [Actinoplanes awajinensis]|nr:hypothetical protein [Actinoplanes awajinensis]